MRILTFVAMWLKLVTLSSLSAPSESAVSNALQQC